MNPQDIVHGVTCRSWASDIISYYRRCCNGSYNSMLESSLSQQQSIDQKLCTQTYMIKAILDATTSYDIQMNHSTRDCAVTAW